MGRPRKEPMGVDGETLTAELIKSGHGAKIGSRLYLRYPQPETDTKALRRDSFFGKNRPVDYNTFEVFKCLDNAMREAMDIYLAFMEVKERVAQYLNAEGETEHDQYHQWNVPPELNECYYKLMETTRHSDFWRTANGCASKFWDITQTSMGFPKKDVPSDIWEAMAATKGETSEESE